MKTIIIEDEEMSRVSLERLCEKIKGFNLLQSFDNGLDALEFLKEVSVDLLLLDVEMPGFSGLDLLDTLKNKPLVIFTTSKTDYAMEAFEYQAVDYLTKPVQLPRLMKAVERARQFHDQIDKEEDIFDEIFIKTDGRYIKLPLDEILYVETLGDYVIFHTENQKKHVVHSSLKSIDEKLRHLQFVKVHRSFVVNTSKIVDIEESNMVIGDRVIPISRANKPVLMNKLKII